MKISLLNESKVTLIWVLSSKENNFLNISHTQDIFTQTIILVTDDFTKNQYLISKTVFKNSAPKCHSIQHSIQFLRLETGKTNKTYTFLSLFLSQVMGGTKNVYLQIIGFVGSI